jgi:sugar phosphate isomerase/epimerase
MYSRRDLGRIALVGLPLAMARAAVSSVINGVRIGNMTYSFRDLPLDAAIKAQAEAGIGDCELDFAGDREGRERLRNWRLTTALDEYKAIRKKFQDAGVPLWGMIYIVRDDFTDEEIERGFQFARALGVNVLTGSSTVSVIPRVAPFAEQYKIPYGVHGHSNVKDPNGFATSGSFAKAMAVSKYIGVNLDVGHFFAAGYDPVEWIRENHARITNVDLCDRKKSQGPQVAWGEGDTPLKDVLLLMKKEKYPFPATIQYEYKGTQDSLTEVKRCFQYCKEVLALSMNL